MGDMADDLTFQPDFEEDLEDITDQDLDDVSYETLSEVSADGSLGVRTPSPPVISNHPKRKPKKNAKLKPGQGRIDYQVRLRYLFRNARFFLVKNHSADNIKLSQDQGVWLTTPKVTQTLSKSQNILLIFSVFDNGCFYGFARLSKSCDSSASAIEWELPPRPNAAHSHSVNYHVDWISRKVLPFGPATDICNPWNDMKAIKMGLDSQEIEPRAAEQLCRLFPEDEEIDMAPIMLKSREAARHLDSMNNDPSKNTDLRATLKLKETLKSPAQSQELTPVNVNSIGNVDTCGKAPIFRRLEQPALTNPPLAYPRAEFEEHPLAGHWENYRIPAMLRLGAPPRNAIHERMHYDNLLLRTVGVPTVLPTMSLQATDYGFFDRSRGIPLVTYPNMVQRGPDGLLYRTHGMDPLISPPHATATHSTGGFLFRTIEVPSASARHPVDGFVHRSLDYLPAGAATVRVERPLEVLRFRSAELPQNTIGHDKRIDRQIDEFLDRKKRSRSNSRTKADRVPKKRLESETRSHSLSRSLSRELNRHSKRRNNRSHSRSSSDRSRNVRVRSRKRERERSRSDSRRRSSETPERLVRDLRRGKIDRERKNRRNDRDRSRSRSDNSSSYRYRSRSSNDRRYDRRRSGSPQDRSRSRDRSSRYSSNPDRRDYSHDRRGKSRSRDRDWHRESGRNR